MSLDRKNQLAERILDYLLDEPNPDPSFRALAAAAGVTRPTLVHHFGDHLGTLQAAIMFAGTRARFFHEVATRIDGTAPTVLRTLMGWLVVGWRDRLGRLHHIGLLNGLAQPDLGHAYIDAVLEPTLELFAAVLDRLQNEGELAVKDRRTASLQLLSPLLVALLHQDQLHGQERWPLDVPQFLEHHVETFVRAYAPTPSPPHEL